MSSLVSRQQEKDALKAVLASGIFARAPRQAKLPEYICNENFKRKSEQLNFRSSCRNDLHSVSSYGGLKCLSMPSLRLVMVNLRHN
jgi:hypothetical protein